MGGHKLKKVFLILLIILACVFVKPALAALTDIDIEQLFNRVFDSTTDTLKVEFV